MKPLDEGILKKIAETHGIQYETPPTPFNRLAILTRMARTFRVPKGVLYATLADVGAHNRFFPHLRALNVIDSKQLAGAIGKNQVVVVEGLAEGGSKLGVKLFTFKPTDTIEGELMTDPFVSAQFGPMHKKQGSIVWNFQGIDDANTRMIVESDFGVTANSAYIRGTVDHIWLDSFENLMIHFNELAPDKKLCSPF